MGLITSGAGRDLDQVHKIGYPVFTGETISAHGYRHTPDVHVSVRVGGVMVYPDDLLHADVNGATTIPKEIAADGNLEEADGEKVRNPHPLGHPPLHFRKAENGEGDAFYGFCG